LHCIAYEIREYELSTYCNFSTSTKYVHFDEVLTLHNPISTRNPPQDSQKAQKAVAQALQVLKEFYAKAGNATALIQQQPEAPGIFDSPYQGMGAESGERNKLCDQ
jgi:hypothetical protein